jgi:hypothetical protein
MNGVKIKKRQSIGILPGMNEDIKQKKNMKRRQANKQQDEQKVLTFNKDNTKSKPPIFDYIATFNEIPSIPIHLERQRNLVNRRIQQNLFRGQRNKGWYTHPNMLVKAPFFTSEEHQEVEKDSQIMRSIVKKHEPFISERNDYHEEVHELPYTNLRDVNNLRPLDFPKRDLYL